MADNSGIEWTDATWNPVAGCTAISPGCLNCYAAPMARRLEAMGQAKYAGTAQRNEATGRGEFTGLVRPWADDLMKPFEWKKPKRIFVNSMSDLFHETVPYEFIDRVYAVMELNPRHTFQVLTKRAERMYEYATDHKTPGRVQAAAREIAKGRGEELMNAAGVICWPTFNVIHGVTAENQKYADERIPFLLKTPSYLRFVSAEPLLGEINFSSNLGGIRWMGGQRGHLGTHSHSGKPGAMIHGVVHHQDPRNPHHHCDDRCQRGLDLVITGGESGPKARACDIRWIRSIVVRCQTDNCHCFVKQLGANVLMSFDEWNELTEGGASGSPKFSHLPKNRDYGIWKPVDAKGGDPEEWPMDVRVRMTPNLLSRIDL